MKLYFLRHGESEANLSGVHGGWMQCDLTAAGRSQAQAAAQLLQNISFEQIYASDLARAQQTAQLAVPGQSITLDPRLREIHVGDVIGMTPAECEAKWGRRYIDARNAKNYTDFHGESYAQVGQRVSAFLDHVATAHTGNVLAVSHNHAINTVLNYLFGDMSCEMGWMDNCGVSVFEYKNEKWQLLYWNVTASPAI